MRKYALHKADNYAITSSDGGITVSRSDGGIMLSRTLSDGVLGAEYVAAYGDEAYKLSDGRTLRRIKNRFEIF